MNDADRAALSSLRDTYPPEEFSLQVSQNAGFTVFKFRMLPEIAHELEQTPRTIVYHVDASGIAKLGDVTA